MTKTTTRTAALMLTLTVLAMAAIIPGIAMAYDFVAEDLRVEMRTVPNGLLGEYGENVVVEYWKEVDGGEQLVLIQTHPSILFNK